MKNCVKGTGFIEVLVSLTILSFLLLGFNAMEFAALQANHNAYFFSLAQNQLDAMVQRLEAHPDDVQGELTLWNQQNQALLPNGKGYLSGNPPDSITLFWGQKTTEKNCDHIQLGKINCLKLPV